MAGGYAWHLPRCQNPSGLELDEAVTRREPFADTFRDFVRACVWDAGLQQASRRRTPERVPFAADDLVALRATATEEAPATGVPGGQVTYRLGFGPHRLTATVSDGTARVHVGTDTEDGLGELLALFPAAPHQ